MIARRVDDLVSIDLWSISISLRLRAALPAHHLNMAIWLD